MFYTSQEFACFRNLTASIWRLVCPSVCVNQEDASPICLLAYLRHISMFETSEISSFIFSHIVKTIEIFKVWNFAYYDLWKFCTKYFEGYIEKDFKLVTNANIRELCDFLKQLEVWIEKNTRTFITKTLYDVLQKNEFMKWSKNETWLDFLRSSKVQFSNAALCVNQRAKEKVVKKYRKFRDH